MTNKLSELFEKNRAHVPAWRVLVISGIMFWLPVIVFLAIADEVREHDAIVFDQPILEYLHQHSSPLGDIVAVSFTTIGGPVAVVLLAGIIGWLLWARHQRRQALFAVVAVGSVAVVNVILKTLFERQRPALWQTLVQENSFSFPSGHAMAGAAIATVVICITWNTRWRWYALVGALIYAIGVGVSRLYLGVHFPSDVIGGWCLSVVWVLSLWYLAQKIPFSRKT